MEDTITLLERTPTVAEFRRLREAMGWSCTTDGAMAIGLRSGLYAVCLMHGDEVIGCGRVVGDGGNYFYVQDIMLLSAYRGQGYGKQIVDAVMGFIAAHAQPGAFVGLMAASGVAPFYYQWGFKEREPDRPGMYRVWGQD